MRRRRPATVPLPLRDGVDPVRVRLPAAGADAPGTVRGYLLSRFPASAPELEELFAAGGIVDDAGQVLGIARTIDEVRVRAATLERELDRPRYHVLLMPGSDVPARYQLTLAARRW